MALPRVLAGRYVLEVKLGQGGMGVVYGGTDQLMTRPVAVKLISPDPGVDEEVVERFLREAKTTAKIQHPNIVNVFDLGRGDEGDLFFVMERLEGDALSQRLRAKGRFEPALAVHVAAQIADALAHAHAHGVVHRDLKPANVMLVRRGEDEAFVKVLDFGVAKANDQGTQLTRAGVLLGTVEYMAPEQFLGKPADARSDIYALGILLYRMLTAASPYPDTRVPQIVDYHLNATAAPLASRVPGIMFPVALERALMRSLSKKPAERYGTMVDFALALRASLLVGGATQLDDEDDDPTGAGSGGRKKVNSERPTMNDGEDDDAATMMAHSPFQQLGAPRVGSFDDQPVTSRDIVPPAPLSRVVAPAPAPPKPVASRRGGVVSSVPNGAASAAAVRANITSTENFSGEAPVGLPVSSVNSYRPKQTTGASFHASTRPAAGIVGQDAPARIVSPPGGPSSAAAPRGMSARVPVVLTALATLFLVAGGGAVASGRQVPGMVAFAVGIVILSTAAVFKALQVL